MHVVQALAALSIGGSEIVATEITEYLRKRGCKVTVLAAPGYLSDKVKAMGAETLSWPVDRKHLATLRQIRPIRNWLRKHQPDIVHVHSRLPAFLVWQALRGLRKDERPALVTSMHGHYSVSRYSSVMARGDRIIAVSESIRDYTLHNYPVEPDRIRVIHGGACKQDFPYGHTPTDAWRKQTYLEFPELRERRWLCLPGRLSRYKGHGNFINLVAALLPEFPKLQGVIVGAAREGSRYRDELEGLAISSGISRHITFTGVRTDIRDWLAASEIVLNLCADPPEAFGRTILEALYLGRPAVAWNHGGVAEILSRMYPFGAVPPGNQAALEAQTRTFLKSAPRVEDIDAFPLEDSMEKTYATYLEAISSRGYRDSGR